MTLERADRLRAIPSAKDRSLRRPPTARPVAVMVLLILSLASLGLVTTVDDAAYRVVTGMAQHPAERAQGIRLIFAWLVEARIASCAMCAMLAAVATHRTPQWRHVGAPDWHRAATVALVWLVGSWVAVYRVGVYVPPLPRAVDVAAFIGFGLLAEELLFRGALFTVASRVFPSSTTAPILWSATCFSLQHLQYYHFHPDARALTQVAYTLPMGVVLGYVRSTTRRLWPSMAVHVLNNAITVLHGWSP